LDPCGTHFVIQAKDIEEENNHRLNAEGLDRISPARDLSLNEVRNGDILFLAKGRRRFATLIEDIPTTLPVVALYYFFILRPKNGVIDPAFLVWLINEREVQEYLNSVAQGTTVPSVTKQSFLKLDLTIPPLEKQASIAHLNRLAFLERSLARTLVQQRSDYLNLLCRAFWKEGQE
jgi:restriction endonuclease S subunit